MDIVLNPKWQTDIPGEFEVLPGGRIDFEGVTGVVTLPKDYLEFMKFSDSLVTRDRDAWYIARYADGVVILELEWLSEMENVISDTNYWATTYVDNSGPLIPSGFIVIGANESGFKVLLGVDQDSTDFGKVFAWKQSYDSWMEGKNTNGLGLAGNSFTEFMNSLSPRDAL